MDFLKKMLGFMCLWDGGFSGIAEMTLKVDLSMKSKMYGFPYEKNRFHVSLGAGDLGESQK